MASWTTTNAEGVACDAGLSVPADLDRRGSPAHVAEDAAGAAGALLRGDGRLAQRRRPRRPSEWYKPRPSRPATGARPRAREADRPAAGLPRRPPEQEGAPTRRSLRRAGSARRRVEVGDGAVRYRLSGGADDAADARRVR